MSEKDSTDLSENAAEFEKLAPEKQLSLTQEFFVFVMENKKWCGLVAAALSEAFPCKN